MYLNESKLLPLKEFCDASSVMISHSCPSLNKVRYSTLQAGCAPIGSWPSAKSDFY